MHGTSERKVVAANQKKKLNSGDPIKTPRELLYGGYAWSLYLVDSAGIVGRARELRGGWQKAGLKGEMRRPFQLLSQSACALTP